VDEAMQSRYSRSQEPSWANCKSTVITKHLKLRHVTTLRMRLYSSVTTAPSSVTTKNSLLHLISSFANSSTIVLAMPSWFSVARARMVGPAPERQIPRRPGCDWGVTDDRTRGRPGILEPWRGGQVKEGNGRWSARQRIL
jgi:hypothetical protein